MLALSYDDSDPDQAPRSDALGVLVGVQLRVVVATGEKGMAANTHATVFYTPTLPSGEMFTI